MKKGFFIKTLLTFLFMVLLSNIFANNITRCFYIFSVDTLSILKSNTDDFHTVDSLVVDTVKTDIIITDSISLPSRQSDFKYPVDFSAVDSIVLFGNGNVHLYMDGKLIYKENTPKKVTANFISINMDSTFFYARGVLDSLGNLTGMPVFNEGEQEYRAEEMSYNFKTEKGFIRGARTQEGEGYIIADKTKKTRDGFMNMKDGKYTTCDNLDHPHFYLKLTKGRVKPGGYVTAGPSYMVVEDVPLPLAIPFGFFPFTSKYASGIIMPSYGDELQSGFFLKDGGYYFAISDYWDLAVTGDIYTKGSWGTKLESTYKKRYDFDGNIRIQYNNVVRGEKDLPNYQLKKDLRIDWTHRQDSKASAFSSFSASVNFFTSGFNRNSIDYNYNIAEQSQAESYSSINFTQRLPSLPISFSVNTNLRQSVRDSSVNVTLPNIRMDISTIYPIKNSKRVGKEKFFEKLSFSYSMEFSNSFRGKESIILRSDFSKDWQNGILHSPKIQLPVTLAKYININPQFTYTERWYFKKIEQSWNNPAQRIDYDTVSGFYRVYDFSAGVSVSTTIYGFYSPIKSIKDALGIGDIRHVFRPSISFTYMPDFSDPKWDMYKTYMQERVNSGTGQVDIQEIKYSPYASGKYGVPVSGRRQSIKISFDNNIEMKIKDKAASDTTGNIVYKKRSIIDNFYIGSGYNFVADSLRMDNINASIRLKITDSYSVTLRTSFEPYMYGLTRDSVPVRIDQYRWKYKKAPWFTGTSIDFSYTLNNNTFKKKNKNISGNKDAYSAEPHPDDFNLNPSQNHNDSISMDMKKIEDDAEGYQKPDVQWSLSFNFGLGWGRTNNFDYTKMEYKRDFNGGIMGLSGYLNLTSNWQISYSASLSLLKKIDLHSLSLNLKRNLHCWSLTASLTPVGYNKSFMVTIGANAAMLRDLKYDKRQRDNIEIR